MATRGWENVRASDLGKMGAQPRKVSKYRNVQTLIGSERFDSKREAARWLQLQAMHSSGEIADLQRQVPFDLLAPNLKAANGTYTVIATYIADFVYLRDGVKIVEDAKGKRTAIYSLKAKWLELQSGIVIREV